MFLVWLNPAVSMTPTGQDSDIYSIGTQTNASGDLEPVDQVEVYASAMQANTNNQTTVPVYALEPQWDPSTQQYYLPGLASICANLNTSEYNSFTCTQGDQCGCQPSDFTEILAEDAILGYGPTDNPLGADTSGATTCGQLPSTSSSSKCRYLPVPTSTGSSTQLTELLAGPSCQTCNTPVNSVTLSDSTMATQTYNESFSYGVEYSWKANLTVAGWGGGVSFKWTDNESSGQLNGHANTMNGTFSSNTVDCYEDIPIFYDTLYHTYVFWQPSGNSSCP